METPRQFYWFLGKASTIFFLGAVLYYGWLMPDFRVQNWLTKEISNETAIILSLFYKNVLVQQYDYGIYRVLVDYVPSIKIGYPCNGLAIFMIFAGFVMAYPGSVKLKLVYIPLGIAILHIANILRIVALSFNFLLHNSTFDLNHKFTFAFIIYSMVGGLWMLWANYLSRKTDFASVFKFGKLELKAQ